MARRIVEQLVDDIDGGKAAESISFSYRGVDYLIDLSSKNAKALDKTMAPYLDAARRVSGRRRTSARTTGRSSEAKAIREWAASEGIEVPARGRINADVKQRYEAAHGG